MQVTLARHVTDQTGEDQAKPPLDRDVAVHFSANATADGTFEVPALPVGVRCTIHFGSGNAKTAMWQQEIDMATEILVGDVVVKQDGGQGK